MSSRTCIICNAEASVYDESRRGWTCEAHAPPPAERLARERRRHLETFKREIRHMYSWSSALTGDIANAMGVYHVTPALLTDEQRKALIETLEMARLLRDAGGNIAGVLERALAIEETA